MRELLPKSIHRTIYLTALIFLSLGIIYSGPVASVSIMVLGGNWFLELNYRERLKRFLNNRVAILLSSIFFIHALGLLWSHDLHNGWNDVRVKVPLFVLPFIISTTDPLSRKHFQILLRFFTAGILVSTFISTLILKGIIPYKIHDLRGISIYVSHIRLSLMICLCIFILAYDIVKNSSALIRIAGILLAIWLIIFLCILESLTGLGILAISMLIISISFFDFRKSFFCKCALFTVFALFIGCGIYVLSIASSFFHLKPIETKNLETTTPSGHAYFNEPSFPIVENGNYILLHICWEELQIGWEKKSKIPFNGKDANGNSIRQSLIRYMTSRGFERKNTSTFAQLSDEEIRLIEQGITNYKYPNLSSLSSRIYETIWEVDVYRKGGNPSGHSAVMRLEFWKTGLNILRKNLLFGTGTGDVRDAFHQQYKIDNSRLDESHQLRGHNQYMTIGIALGVPGLILFIISLIYPLFKNKMYKNYFFLVYWIILALSFLTEDTLESQAGVTLYALFGAVFLFAQPEENFSSTAHASSSQRE